MRKIVLTLILLVLSLYFSSDLFALDDKVCACGYNLGGDCIPCDETKVSGTPSLENNKTFKDIQCECGYDPGGECVPCKESLDAQERKLGEEQTNN